MKEMSGHSGSRPANDAKGGGHGELFRRPHESAPGSVPQAYDMPMTVETLITADELLRLPDDGSRHELVKGELRKMSPSGARHGRIAAKIIGKLVAYTQAHKTGAVYASEVGFRIARNPDTVRAPDAAFVRAERVVDTPGFFEGPPDVAFEVVSPSDSYSHVQAKTKDWLRAGTCVVVVVDPSTRGIAIHRPDNTQQHTDGIRIDDVIPGWEMSAADVFDL